MKAIIKFTAIALLISTGAFAQFLFDDGSIKLPNMTPPSPETYALTKYGGTPVNEFTGMLSTTVPLYTYKAGQLELPISLNYTGAGVKVDDLPTWVGINWTLNAGGVITRTVKDLPDETVGNNRVFLTDSEVSNYSINLINGSPEAQFIKSLIGHDSKDTEADIFNFNFAGYSGSFYFDQELKNGILTKNDSPLKIKAESLNNTKTIEITTPDGIKYYFGGSGATEDTELRYKKGKNIEKVTSQGTTAFYLSKIEHPINGIIVFVYNTSGIQNIVLTNEQTQDSPLYWVAGNSDLDRCCGNSPNVGTSSGIVSVINRVIDPKYLRKIISPLNNEEVIFTSSSINNAHFKRVLNFIEVKKDTVIKKIEFEFTPFQASGAFLGYPDNTKRFFLKKIIFDSHLDSSDLNNGSNGRKNEVYSFLYNDYNSLPERFSYEQDALGYYNGQIDNTNLIPNNPVFNPNNLAGFADRSPDFDLASKGTLTQIYYPTGGHTFIEYEGTKAKKRKYGGATLKAYRNLSNLTMPNQLVDNISQETENGIIFGTQNIVETQTVTVNVTLRAYRRYNNSSYSVSPQSAKALIKIWNLNDPIHSVIPPTYIYAPSPRPDDENLIVETNIPITCSFSENGRYQIQIEIITNPELTLSSQVPMEVFADVAFIEGYSVVNDLGVRVKRVTDFSSEGVVSNIKRYYYSEMNKVNSPISDLPFQENYSGIQTSNVMNYICMNGSTDPFCQANLGSGGAIEFAKGFITLSSASFNNFFKQDRGVNNNESTVTISYGGDDFENGGVEKTFYVQESISALELDTKAYPGQPDYDSYVTTPKVEIPPVLNGQIRKEKVYTNKNGNLLKIKEIDCIYDWSLSGHINNLFGAELYSMNFFPSGHNIGNTISNYYVGVYRINSYRNEVTSKKVTEYIDPVPLSVEDESMYKKIVSTQKFEYGALRGLPTRITDSIGVSGIEKVTRNYYVNEAVNFNDLANPAHVYGYNKLLDLNRVSTPVHVETFSNASLLSKHRTLYKQWGNNVNNVQPNIIQTAKGENDLEERIVFSEYDTHGNLQEVALKDGAITKYYYNTNNQIVLKIENWGEPSGVAGQTLSTEPLDYDIPDNCDLRASFPKSLVTIYFYNSFNKIRMIKDANCRNTYYEYDDLHRLIRIKDHEGNVLKEFETNFRRY